MYNYGFKEYSIKTVKEIMISTSKAIAIAKKWFSNIMIKIIIEYLSALPDANKLKRLIILANMKGRAKGDSSINVINGIKMTVNITTKGSIELISYRKEFKDAMEIWERLQIAGYNAKLGRRGKRFAVYIKGSEVLSHPELAIKVRDILRRMYEEAVSEGKVERAWRIARALSKLNFNN